RNEYRGNGVAANAFANTFRLTCETIPYNRKYEVNAMRVGCPKEIKNHEYRVGLTPGSVREYIAHGHDVLVEARAGAGIGADDNAYRSAGAKVVKSAAEVFEKA